MYHTVVGWNSGQPVVGFYLVFTYPGVRFRINSNQTTECRMSGRLIITTVDGRNLHQLIGIDFIPTFTRFCTFQVVQDFFHQQYHLSSWLVGLKTLCVCMIITSLYQHVYLHIYIYNHFIVPIILFHDCQSRHVEFRFGSTASFPCFLCWLLDFSVQPYKSMGCKTWKWRYTGFTW